MIGAGVAGLAAIGAARGLGAIVRAFDTRPAVREQVESLGAEFLELNVVEDGEGAGGYAKEMSEAFIEAEMALFAAQAKDVDIIITTALIPDARRPILITERDGRGDEARLGDRRPRRRARRQLRAHRAGTGRRAPRRHIIGFTDLPSRIAPTASELYGNNLTHLLEELGGASHFHLDLDDEVVRGALVLQDGELLWPPPRAEPPRRHAAGARSRSQARAGPPRPRRQKQSRGAATGPRASPARVALGALGLVAPPAFLQHLTVFVLACVVGWQVVWNVTPALHTPLMSVTNAISGIIVIGGMLQVERAAGFGRRRSSAPSRSCSRRSTSPAASSSRSACCACSAE